MMTQPPLRVLHVIDHLGIGGTQVLLANLCTWPIDSTSAARHEVLALHGAGPHFDRLSRDGIAVRSLSASKQNMLRIVACLVAHLSRRDYDVLHLHLQASSLLGAVISALVRRAPTIVTVYALKEQLRWPRFYLFAAIAPMTKAFVSLWHNSDLASVGIDAKRVEVIQIGIDVRGADPARHLEVRRAICERYGLRAEQPLLLSVARLHADRHIHLLIEAMIHIAAECPEARLLMIGDGEEQRRLEAMLREHQLEQNVIFAGVRTDLWDLYPGCDIYMSSSGDCDTGVAAMQAMACGRPVVTYTIAPMSEPRKLCECQGVFVQTRDPAAMAQATLDLLRDPDEARRLGERGQAQILEQFSLDSMVQRYNSLYARVRAAAA